MPVSGVSECAATPSSQPQAWSPKSADQRRTSNHDTAARHKHSDAPGNKFAYFCASRLEQVQSAWQLVYRRYVEMNLIHENPFGIHTTPMALGRQTCVICGPGERGVGVGVGVTMTFVSDNDQGIPLDTVYTPHLDKLRSGGRRLVEVGLLADHGRRTSRSATALFRMMRWAAYYTLHTGSTDIIIGVHPHHAPFYARCFGFKKVAPPTHYPLVRDNPVVPLRLPLREGMAQAVLPRGLAYVRDNPLPTDAFSRRFEFTPEQMRGSLIEAFLQDQSTPAPEPAAPNTTTWPMPPGAVGLAAAT